MFKWTEIALAFGFLNNTSRLDPMLFNLLLEERRMERLALVAAAKAAKLTRSTTADASNDSCNAAEPAKHNSAAAKKAA